MIRWVLWLIGGLVLGGIVHLTTILMMPRTATQDAYSRLSPVTPVNAFVPLPDPSADDPIVPFRDPAFAASVCRFDLAAGPLKLQAPVTQAYTSMSFYTRVGVPFYSINDRAAGRRSIELDLMTAQQRSQLPEEEDVTAADRLIVEAPTTAGLIVVRAMATEPSLLPSIRDALTSTRCGTQQ